MGTIKIVLSDQLEEKLRRRIAFEKGFHKGVLSEAVQEAIELWLHNPTTKIDVEKLRKQFPGKYLGIVQGEVEYSCDTLEELFSIIKESQEKIFVAYPEMTQRKVKLGWRSSEI